MNITNNDTTPMLAINGYEIVAVNCTDSTHAVTLAEQKIFEIEKRLAAIKAERTLLNRHHHILTRWLGKQVGLN